MLSAETASGKYPVEVVETMASMILQEADKSEQVELDLQFVNQTFNRVDQSISSRRTVHRVPPAGLPRSVR